MPPVEFEDRDSCRPLDKSVDFSGRGNQTWDDRSDRSDYRTDFRRSGASSFGEDRRGSGASSFGEDRRGSGASAFGEDRRGSMQSHRRRSPSPPPRVHVGAPLLSEAREIRF
jgi:hypothetical protein